MKTQNLILILTVFFLISCSKNKEANVEKSIENLITNFPQLNNSKKTFGNNYKLVKTIKNGKFGFEIQLFSEPDSIQGKQEIIIFINSNKECYPIPFFSNKYKDYWEFAFDEQIKDVSKVNSTFSKELNIALEKMYAKQNTKNEIIKYEVVNELLYSVLNCRKLEERDSLLVYKTISMNLDIPIEESDSAFVRLRKNYETMKKDWHPEKYKTNYNCYLDKKNARIYQFKNQYNSKQIRINTYRQDYGFRYLYM